MYRQYAVKQGKNIMNMLCPGNNLRWDLNVEDIAGKTEELIEKSKSVYDSVGSLSPDETNYDNVIKALADLDSTYTTEKHILTFVQHVSSNKELREASVEADKKISDFDVEMSMRQDVFDNLVAVEKNLGDELQGEAKRYLEKMIKDGKRTGLCLSKEKQEQIKEIKKRMSNLGIDFNKNVDEDTTTLEFSKEELVGMQDDFFESLEKTDDGKFKVTLQYPHYFPCARFARNPETRKKLETAFHSRCIKENTPILEELVELRQQKAELLGYPTHAAFILDIRMAKTPERVATFLSELKDKLQTLKEQELELYLTYKKQECEEYGYDYDGKINMWDFRYYMRHAEEKKYSVDENRLKEYYPLDVVTTGLLDIYQTLLNLRYEEIPEAEVWHKDVKVYKVLNLKDGLLLGYFYLDLFPREGKFSHAACFGLQPGCLLSNKSRQVAVAAMVANFTKPTEEKPSLLTHEEVETYFHEFGHVMHDICAQADFAFFSGTSVECDFVEAPSQMLENWCWQKESLSKMSSHYQDKSPIPDDLLESLVQSRNANAGIFNLRQILLASFDQRIHTQAKADIAQEFMDLADPVMGVPATEGTSMPASFAHLADGYDAQYYGYLWSEVFSADMFYSRFKKEGIMSSEVGMDYRKYILQPGGSMDADDMLKNFLGREPNQEAFLIHKGLKSA